jgi:hypothetical protein
MLVVVSVAAGASVEDPVPVVADASVVDVVSVVDGAPVVDTVSSPAQATRAVTANRAGSARATGFVMSFRMIVPSPVSSSYPFRRRTGHI